MQDVATTNDAANDAIVDTGTDAAVDGGSTTPPSCIGLAKTCGPMSNEDCCATIQVPGGTFKRSYNGVDYQDPTYTATVSTFSLDRFEVTVRRFKKWIAAYPANKPKPGDGKNAYVAADKGWDISWDGNLPAMQANIAPLLMCGQAPTFGAGEVLPINCVDWYMAYAFCAWDGGFLPTEAQWNYAAVGGTEQRVWPWSNPPNQNFINTTVAVVNDTKPSNVGSRSPMGDAKWGHADMVGNVLELLLDWYVDPYPLPCNDCANLTPTPYRTNRAGHYQTVNNAYASPSFRNLGAATDRQSQIGVRCARK